MISQFCKPGAAPRACEEAYPGVHRQGNREANSGDLPSEGLFLLGAFSVFLCISSILMYFTHGMMISADQCYES